MGIISLTTKELPHMLLSIFYIWGIQGSNGLTDLPKATLLVSVAVLISIYGFLKNYWCPTLSMMLLCHLSPCHFFCVPFIFLWQVGGFGSILSFSFWLPPITSFKIDTKERKKDAFAKFIFSTGLLHHFIIVRVTFFIVLNYLFFSGCSHSSTSPVNFLSPSYHENFVFIKTGILETSYRGWSITHQVLTKNLGANYNSSKQTPIQLPFPYFLHACVWIFLLLQTLTQTNPYTIFLLFPLIPGQLTFA